MSAEDYVLGRAVEDSVRLDAQHLLWRLQQGQLLHPDISLEDGQSIAEIGCGTGIWLLDLAQSVPNSIKLFGFDVSNRQFPPKEDWPENLSFGVLDSLQDVPADLLEKFDIVHVQPGGYLQWEEADLVDQVVRSDLAHEFERNINNLFELAGLNYS
ncbi:unnamed protein product [Clonostachys chloroleuca]|uniref:Methyltransferase domain-containing protein n=1 Tax=Clonostachys chloroleuca TaxID=1926264 RepID=A0AA35M577_9HYPO|nr:unnamed protein product [Clonostachys chloroleuca]